MTLGVSRESYLYHGTCNQYQQHNIIVSNNEEDNNRQNTSNDTATGRHFQSKSI